MLSGRCRKMLERRCRHSVLALQTSPRIAVQEQFQDAKVLIFKKRRRKNSRRLNGHRQVCDGMLPLGAALIFLGLVLAEHGPSCLSLHLDRPAVCRGLPKVPNANLWAAHALHRGSSMCLRRLCRAGPDISEDHRHRGHYRDSPGDIWQCCCAARGEGCLSASRRTCCGKS